MIAAAPMGDSNASIPTPEPVYYRHMFSAYGRAVQASAVTFVSQAGLAADLSTTLALKKRLLPVQGTRHIGKGNMIHNDALPKMEVDPETYLVRADGELLIWEPATVLSMAQRYFLY